MRNSDTVRVSVTLTVQERDMLKRRAEASGMTLSAYLLELIRRVR